jgi:hypothetical protein
MGVSDAERALLLRAFAWGEGTELYMPFVRDPEISTDGPEQYLPHLVENGTNALPEHSKTLLYDLLRRSLFAGEWPPTLPSTSNLITALNDYRSVVSAADFDQRVDAALRDIIDALTYRLDAWYSTLPAKRLKMMRTRTPDGLLWGAYGYVEDIRFPPQPTLGRLDAGGGYIHAPSIAQASAAALLRSAFDSHRDDEDPGAYALSLTSRRVGRALTLIDGVQQGQDLPALLGYQFERGLHNANLDRLIDDFRAAFPIISPDDADAASLAEVVVPRHVCDGRELAEAFRTSFVDSPEIADLISGLDAADRNTLRGLLVELVDATDAVGDLLVFEGVFQAVQGNYERSGSALDACAGIGTPPTVESVATHLGGNNLRHRVCVLLPCAASEDDGTGSRAAAEPRLNVWTGSMLGELSTIGCRVYATGDAVDGSDPVDRDSPFRVTLADLLPEISPLDFVHMCSALPTGTGDTEIELRIRRHVRSRWALADDVRLRIAVEEPPADAPTNTRPLIHAMELGRAILDVLGNATVLTPGGLMHPDDAPGSASPTESDPVFYSPDTVRRLRERVETARDLLCRQTAILGSNDATATACDLQPSAGPGDATVIAPALDACAGFGIQEALLTSDNDPSLERRRLQVFTIASKRVTDADALLAAATDETEASVPLLTSALKVLFGESFVVLPEFATPGSDPRFAAFNASTIAPVPSEDRIWLWLQQVAETHPRVRVLETLLMVVDAWGTLRGNAAFLGLRLAQLPFRPEFDWQALADAELRGDAGRARGCQSIVGMLPDDFALACVAGFIIDEWTETIPASTVTTGVSFEYNQPGQQAPQCLLLAVPGNFDDPTWTAEHLAGIVRDTMDLARARLVDLDAFPAVAGIFPALLFPITAGGQPQSPGL